MTVSPLSGNKMVLVKRSIENNSDWRFSPFSWFKTSWWFQSITTMFLVVFSLLTNTLQYTTVYYYTVEGYTVSPLLDCTNECLLWMLWMPLKVDINSWYDLRMTGFWYIYIFYIFVFIVFFTVLFIVVLYYSHTRTHMEHSFSIWYHYNRFLYWTCYIHFVSSLILH